MVNLAKSLNVNRFRFSVPCIPWGDGSDYYVPLKDLPKYVDNLINHPLNNKEMVGFKDIPYCVFGGYYNFIEFYSSLSIVIF